MHIIKYCKNNARNRAGFKFVLVRTHPNITEQFIETMFSNVK